MIGWLARIKSVDKQLVGTMQIGYPQIEMAQFDWIMINHEMKQ